MMSIKGKSETAREVVDPIIAPTTYSHCGNDVFD